MDPSQVYQNKKKSLDEFLELIQPKDFISTPIGAGQPRNLLNHLSNLKNIEELKLFTGLLAFPYPILTHPKIQTISGYYGPIERMLNQSGYNVAYQPLPFRGFEVYAREKKPRVVMTTLSSMDEAGYLSFGVECEAVYLPFLEAAKDPQRLAIAEVNSKMPRIHGLPEFGDNKIHVSQISALVEIESTLSEIPASEPTEVEKKIAENVLKLIKDGDTLQFGIGGIPNHVATLLAQTDLGDFGIHSELISDGFLTLMESGKISNQRKGLHEGKSVFAFALGSQKLYDYLDERNGHNQGRTVAAPVSYVNDPTVIAKHQNMVGINSGFMIDLSGQVCSEAIGERQYSGVGGQFDFVQGAFFSPGGRSILCIKSSVMHEGKHFSNIVNHLPSGSIISTPRHYLQYVVTEYGSVNLFGLTDEERPLALIKIAHPDFQEELLKQAKTRDAQSYHSRFFHE